MWAIRKPCYGYDPFNNIRHYKVRGLNKHGDIYLEDIGVWNSYKFIVVKTLEQANEIIKLIKEKNNE